MLIRDAHSHADLDAVVDIQKEVWGIADVDACGAIQLRATMHAGASLLLGVEEQSGVVAGFAYAFPAFRDGRTWWHSDMLAVRPAFRASGLGTKLKWAQRDRALAAGIHLITWTFDPMQAKNAHLNLNLLGATCGEYVRNFYGITTASLHHGLPTDRLVAEWDLRSDRVAKLASGGSPKTIDAERHVRVPEDWNGLVSANDAEARREKTRVAGELEAAFRDGARAIGFHRTLCAYVLD